VLKLRSNGNEGVPLYRCRVGSRGQMLTHSSTCETVNMTGQQIGFISPTQAAGTIPLYRILCTANGDHLQTNDPNEVNRLSNDNNGRSEGISGYVLPR
jgi:hypothetical protein